MKIFKSAALFALLLGNRMLHGSFQPEKVHRIILKISGEFLAGTKNNGFDHDTLEQLTSDIIEVKKLSLGIGIVLGGGNLYRGASEEANGMARVTGDDIGMLATLQNSLVLSSYIKKQNYQCEVFSALQVDKVAQFYTAEKAEKALSKGKICFFAGGTGNPYFTTDTAAVLRALELNADLVLKGTKVDGVFSADPTTCNDAEFYHEISYDETLVKRLNVMDMTAFTLARDNRLYMKVFNITKPGNLKSAISRKDVGTFIHF